MIHQLIFASPKPGMSETDFQRYWIEEHAVKYACKIPQIRRYLIDSRIPFGDDDTAPIFGGVAEIWLENEEEQLASLQTDAFLQGARLDEPRWAAFWKTMVLDTTAHVIIEGNSCEQVNQGCKVLMLVKRMPGLSLSEFREYMLGDHAKLAGDIPGVRRYLQCHTRDGAYQLGEARFDCVLQLWFDGVEAANRALAWFFQRELRHPDLTRVADPNNVFSILVKEQWIIGPELRSSEKIKSKSGVQTVTDPNSSSTRAVADRWFNAVANGDAETAASCLADDVEWINYTPIKGYNDIMPWIGTYHGRDEVMRTFGIFLDLVEVKHEELVNLLVEGDEAAGVIHEISTVKSNGIDFEIEFIQWLTVRDGKIVRWKSYTDPSSIIAAMEGKIVTPGASL